MLHLQPYQGLLKHPNYIDYLFDTEITDKLHIFAKLASSLDLSSFIAVLLNSKQGIISS